VVFSSPLGAPSHFSQSYARLPGDSPLTVSAAVPSDRLGTGDPPGLPILSGTPDQSNLVGVGGRLGRVHDGRREDLG